jgi:Fic family protein
VLGWAGQRRRDLQAEVIHASTAMEGVPVTVDEVRRILAGDRPAQVSPADAALVEGYREAMTYCQRRADDPDFAWSPELIKAVHDRIVAGRRDHGAGRFGGPRSVADSRTGELVFTPPQDDVGRWIERVCDRMNTNEEHPALRAAWIHVAIAAVHPFKNGNGRLTRVLASLAMYRGGFRRPEFSSLEEWWGRHLAAYYAAFRCLGARFDAAADVTPFVRAHLAAQLSQVRALDLRERTTRRIWEVLEQSAAEAGLPDRAVFALWEGFNGRPLTRPYYAALADVGPTAVSQDLAALQAAHLLAPVGRTRARRWLAGDRLLPAVARALGLPRGSDRAAIVAAIASALSEELDLRARGQRS